MSLPAQRREGTIITRVCRKDVCAGCRLFEIPPIPDSLTMPILRHLMSALPERGRGQGAKARPGPHRKERQRGWQLGLVKRQRRARPHGVDEGQIEIALEREGVVVGGEALERRVEPADFSA